MKFSKFFRPLSLFFGLVFLIAPTLVQAQVDVGVRGGNHDGYSRLVFDWPISPTYTLSKDGNALMVSFNKKATIDTNGLNSQSFKNIGQVDVVSKSGQDLKLSIQVKAASKYRHFKVENRILVDVYDAPGELAAKEVRPAVKTEKESMAPPPAQADLKPAEEKAEVVAKETKLRITGLQPHLIKLTATRNVGMAAFERAGYLWLVFDDPKLKVAPKIAGPDSKDFPPLEKFQFNNATAYRMPVPKDVNFYGEGGGLIWDLIVTPNPRPVTPLKPETERSDTPNLMQGGTLVWPMTAARRFIKIKDPLLSDEIYVVTVDQSDQYAGDRRQYVEFEILPSFVGLAMLPKADDLEVTANTRGVRITRPRGLALSPERDTAPVVLKDDIEKETAMFEAEEKTTSLNTIFDFDRWEMGGLQALEENRRVIMVGIGNKNGSGKVEDLITLAKLNVANDRGQEALGLLRVAANELPGIEENAEYLALRGAAGALAGKYDEAIEDLLSPATEPYDELGYWRAFTLAGLEDWRQADKLMPADLDLLETYPVQIKRPLSLAMAEVALRAGKSDVAERLLDGLEEEYGKMSLARRSAWTYLDGELERQTGDVETALKRWKKLIQGRDDYYRAKAGLSLTKLQLARQKITPAKAVDRLEGLRYAWRGDELETLINFRLGEVYIDNNDYLKGLSVLRNTVAQSPNSIMAQEVTDYMTNTFRGLFANDKLKDVPPLDAVSVYEEFKELTPLGSEGDAFVQKLAERLVSVDLLGRATALLEHQLDHRLKGAQATPVAIRLAAISLLDAKPEAALKYLKRADEALRIPSTDAVGDKTSQKREIRLLRARALSKTGEAAKALSILAEMKDDQDVLRLRADVAWGAGLWEEAAISFQDLIIAEDISLTRPADDYQTNLILNRAIALNLAGNRVAIANLRERYGDLMTQSDKGRLFDLVTRPRQIGLLNNKESVSSLISEVDLFGDFIENYRKIN